MNNIYKIGFRNSNQVALYQHELKGQISDGNWENSRPYNHYKLPCEAIAFVAANDSELGRNFAARAYNFSDSDLLEVVGQRMINIVKSNIAFPGKLTWDEDDSPSEVVNNWIKYAKTDNSPSKYWESKLNNYIKDYGATSPENLIDIITEKFNSIEYTEKELRKDLNDMKKIWKITNNN